MGITGDRALERLKASLRPLQSLFRAEDAVELLPPELPARLAILDADQRRGGFSVVEACARQIARRFPGNVREMRRALHNLGEYCRLTGAPATPAVLRELLCPSRFPFEGDLN